MFPVSVESKVEQYFQYSCLAPPAANQSAAIEQSFTAFSTGSVRHLSATISISDSPPDGLVGRPKCSVTDAPLRLSSPAKSVAPVKSSAIQPSFMHYFLAT